MTDNDRTLDAEFYESLTDQISLSGRSPHSAARPVAMPKTRAVKRDNVTLPLTGEAEQPAQIEILGGDDITVEKDYWTAPALLEVVKLGTVDGNKPPDRPPRSNRTSCVGRRSLEW